MITLSEEAVTASDVRRLLLRDFAMHLQTLRRRAGEPSLRTLAARIRDSGGSLSVTTLNDVFNGKRLPTWEALTLIAAALDADANHLKPLWEEVASARYIPPAERQSEEYTQKYLKQVAAFSNQVKLPSRTIDTRATLDDIYVEQRITDVESSATFELSLLDKEFCRAVLVGNPGTGKTTACHAIMYRHTQRRGSPIPFLVTIREFFSRVPPERSVVSVIEHVAETFFQARPPEGYVAKQLTDGRALVIFDGLDELPIDAARSTSSIIELFCQEFPQAQVIVTSRPVGYARVSLDPELFRLFRLEEFTSDQIQDYLVKWFTLNQIPLDKVQDWLESSEPIADVRANPLFLSFAAQLYRYQEYVPRDALDIVSRMAELLLRDWDQVRGISIDNRTQMYLIPMLSFLAFQMIDSGSGQISESDLISRLTAYLTSTLNLPMEAGSTARDFLDIIRERSWLLSQVGITSTGESILAFTYRTFMEYFAATYIAHSDNPAGLIGRLLSRPELLTVLEFALTLVDQATPGAAYRFVKIASNKAQDVNPEVRERVGHHLAEIRRSRSDFSS